MTDLIDAFTEYFEVLPATTPELRETAFRIRYEVYSREIQLPTFERWRYPDQRERDSYDEHSAHCLLRHRPTGNWAGLVRLVMAPREAPNKPFPVETAVGDTIDKTQLVNLPRDRTAEISRLILTQNFRRRLGEANSRCVGHNETALQDDGGQRRFPYPILGLMVGAMRLSVEHGITHCLASMEPRLNRLLGRFAFRLTAIGPPVNYCGIRRPYIGGVDDIMANAYRANRPVWDLLTDRGRLYSPPATSTADARNLKTGNH